MYFVLLHWLMFSLKCEQVQKSASTHYTHEKQVLISYAVLLSQVNVSCWMYF